MLRNINHRRDGICGPLRQEGNGITIIDLNSISATFTRPNPNDFLHGGYEDLSVSNFSSLGNPLNGFDHLRNDFVGGDQFNLHLRDEVDLVFSRSIDLGMTLLPSETLNLRDGHPLDTEFG